MSWWARMKTALSKKTNGHVNGKATDAIVAAAAGAIDYDAPQRALTAMQDVLSDKTKEAQRETHKVVESHNAVASAAVRLALRADPKSSG